MLSWQVVKAIAIVVSFVFYTGAFFFYREIGPYCATSKRIFVGSGLVLIAGIGLSQGVWYCGLMVMSVLLAAFVWGVVRKLFHGASRQLLLGTGIVLSLWPILAIPLVSAPYLDFGVISRPSVAFPTLAWGMLGALAMGLVIALARFAIDRKSKRACGLFIVVFMILANWYVAGSVDWGSVMQNPRRLRYLLYSRPGIRSVRVGGGETIIHLTAERGSVTCLRVLLSGYGDVNVRDFFGNTPIHHAMMTLRDDVMALLIESGADVNAKNHRGQAPIHIASALGYPKLIQRLIEARADLNATDRDGMTALHYACRGGGLDAIKLLLLAGAQINPLTARGQTPLDMVSQMSFEVTGEDIEETIDTMRKYGARKSLPQKNAID